MSTHKAEALRDLLIAVERAKTMRQAHGLNSPEHRAAELARVAALEAYSDAVKGEQTHSPTGGQ